MMDYAQLTLPHSSLGMMSPYELLYGRPPRASFDWSPPAKAPANASERLSREQAKALATRMSNAITKGREFMLEAQKKKERDVNPHWRLVDFGTDDKVWVSTKPWTTQRPSEKLDHQSAGPWEVVEPIGHSWRVKLPDSVKVHDVFPNGRLRKAAEDPLPGQINDPPPPI